MTKEKLQEIYEKWAAERDQRPIDDLFSCPIGNFDLMENEERLVNRIYYTVPYFIDHRLFCFTFYEENSFQKDSEGEMQSLHSTFGIEP